VNQPPSSLGSAVVDDALQQLDRKPHQASSPREIQLVVAGSLRAGRRAAVIMSLIQSAKLNGHDPYRYLKDVLERLPTHPASRIDELLPHRWPPAATEA